MATTESRSGFRLPWSPDGEPSMDGSDESPEGEPLTGDPESSAPGMEVAEALEPAPDPDGGPLASIEPVVPVAPVAPVATTVAGAAPARRPTQFLIDLTHAMQAAAEQARAATLEQFRVEGSTHVEQIQGRSTAGADALRRHADEDVASIKEWSKTEIARIREQTENRITGRRGQLDGQLARHAVLVDREIARIEGQIASFEAEMAAFFDELLAESDLTILAARAQQMPEAPAFDEPDDTAFSALMTEPGIGIPVAAAIAEPEPSADVAATTGAAEVAPGRDPRLAMLGPTPDFAAAEAAAAEAAEAEVSEIPDLDGENLAARLAGLGQPATSGTSDDAPPAAAVSSTQVVVTGLASVSSIASFKRHLSRQAGVRHVGVSSGPDGEFRFTAQHEAEVSLRDLLPALPGFGARVTGGGDGVVTASAHDPED